MGFKKSILLMVLHCVDDSMVYDIGAPLARLSTEIGNIPVIQIMDVDGNDMTYSYDRFIQIIDSLGLDGFAF